MAQLHALIIGINGYTQCRPLEGCINDALAVGSFFEELCDAQPNLQWNPRYLLVPGSDAELKQLEAKAYTFDSPTRRNIIDAFRHFDQAQDGDFCLLFYSGHGSTTAAPAVFKGYEPGDVLQTLVCADSRINGNPDLLDKELGYLIARALDGKQPDPAAQKAGVHFLAIIDSCHSGTVTRSGETNAPVARMATSGPMPAIIEGFTTTGNCFYEPFEAGQTRVKPGGLRHARHVNLSAARDTESALEMYFTNMYGERQRRGVFTWSLLETLRQNGTNITYAELIRRVEWMVRTRVDNQIPMLGKTLPEDDGLLFFRNKLRPLAPETFYAAFDERSCEWKLNAGALNGIPDPNTGAETFVKLGQRMIRILSVTPGQAILDPEAFTEADKKLKSQVVTLDTASLNKIRIGWGEPLNDVQKEALRNGFQYTRPAYATLVESNEIPQYLVKMIPHPVATEECFVLTRPGSNIPIFMRTPNVHQFVTDLAKICRYEQVLSLNNPASAIPGDAVTVAVGTLEGVFFNPETFKAISKDDSLFQQVPVQSPEYPYPDLVRVSGKILNGQLLPPALKIRIEVKPGSKYWVGGLYCDEKYSISGEFLPVTCIGFGETSDYLEVDFMQGTYKALPLTIDSAWHNLGVTEIQDYLILFVSTQKFDLKQYEQDGITLDVSRSIGFSNNKAIYRDDWKVIRVPIHVAVPEKPRTLMMGREIEFNGFVISCPNFFSGTCQPFTWAQLRAFAPGEHWQQVLPPDNFWEGRVCYPDVFARGISNLPGTHVCMLEFQIESGDVFLENHMTIYPEDPFGPEEAIIMYGYDVYAERWSTFGYTLDSGVVILTELPGYTPHCFGSAGAESNQSIKVFFQKVAWDGAHEVVEGMQVRKVELPG